MENNPLVTVNILSFNRKKELEETIKKVFEQDYKNIEVIIVDNASSDGTQEMIQAEYPDIKLIALYKNIGISAWNFGVDESHAEFILFLDDDSYPEPGSIFAGVQALQNDEDIGVAGFEIFNSQLKKIENKEGLQFFKENKYSLGFIGCGAIIRKELFIKLNGFNKNIFLYHHEYDFSARVYNLGFRVVLIEGVRVVHNYSKTNRGKRASKNCVDERKYFYGFLSLAVFQIQNISLHFRLVYVIKLFISRFYIAVHLGLVKSYFKASSLILKNIIRCKYDIDPLRRDVQKIYGNGNIKFNDINEF